MKKISLVLLLSLLATNVLASTWCEKDGSDQPILNTCKAATVLATGREVLDLRSVNLGLIGGDDANKNAAGYFKIASTVTPPLQEFQVYSGWVYTFADNEWTKTRQVIMNYDNLTLQEHKWQTYWACYNEYVLPAREADCVFSGQVIPKEARDLMVEAAIAGKTMTYEVYSESTGNPAYYSGSAVQVQGILGSCLDSINTVNSTMATRADDIMACADSDCVNALSCE